MAAADNEDLSDSLAAGIDADEDSEGEGEGDGEDEGEGEGEKRRRVQLRASASVPLFAREERPGQTEELGGSETELARWELGQTGLELTQSYAGQGHTGQGPHKVTSGNRARPGVKTRINISGSVCKH